MHVTRIANLENLQRLGPEWNRLSDGIPFRTWQWLVNWWQHYHAGKSLYTLTVRDDAGTLVGIAPWFIESRGHDGRVVQFLGSGHVCTDFLTILAAPEQAAEVVGAIAEWLICVARTEAASANGWDLLDFDGLPLDDANMQQLVAALNDGGCSSNRRPALNCWRLRLPTSWEEFAAGLTGSHARKVRKLSRRMLDSGRGVLRTVSEPAELERGMRILVDLHQRRWTDLGEPGCFASANFSSFMHSVAFDLLAAEMLKLCWLEIDGEPIAVEFMLMTDEARFMYQGGLDPTKLKQSPGHAIVSASIREAIESGCQYFDFMRGDEPYKATWGARPIQTERIRVAPDRLGPQLRNHAWFAGQTMKGWIKQSLALTGIH